MLQRACERDLGNMPMCALLVDKLSVERHLIYQSMYAAPDEKLMPGPTALHILAIAKDWWQLGAINFLVDRGVDVNARNEKGETPLHIASRGVSKSHFLGRYLPDGNGCCTPPCCSI